MKKTEKMILFIMSGALLLGIFGTWYLNYKKPINSNQPAQKEEKHKYTITGSLDIPNYEIFGKNSEYIATDKEINVGMRYIIRFQSKKLDSSANFSYQSKGEYLKFVYQEIGKKDGKKEVVNLSDLANNYKKGFSLEYNMYTINHKGTDYLVFFVGNYERDYDKYKWIPLVYNLESQKISKYEETIGSIPTDIGYFKKRSSWQQSLSVSIIDTTLNHELQSRYGKQFVDYNVGIYPDEAEKYSNIKINLFDENIDLRHQIKSGKNVFIIPRYGAVNATQWFNDILHWFSPVEGEPLTVHLTYEDYGDKSYPIRSYADYLKATEGKAK